MRNKLTDTI